MNNIEIVYASSTGVQKLIALEVTNHTSVLSAIKQSGILDQFPEIDLNKCAVGIYGRLIETSRIVKNRDRIEIYRPLKQSPIEQRKSRLEQG